MHSLVLPTLGESNTPSRWPPIPYSKPPLWDLRLSTESHLPRVGQDWRRL